MNSKLRASFIFLLLVFSNPGYTLDCVPEKNANDVIEIYAIPNRPEIDQYIFKIFTPIIHEGFKFTHLSLTRNMGKAKENISMELKTSIHDDYQVASVNGELKEIESWVVSVSYFLEGVDPTKDQIIVCPLLGGFASLKNYKPLKEMSATKRGAIKKF